jgi:hypothetical protein
MCADGFKTVLLLCLSLLFNYLLHGSGSGFTTLLQRLENSVHEGLNSTTSPQLYRYNQSPILWREAEVLMNLHPGHRLQQRDPWPGPLYT